MAATDFERQRLLRDLQSRFSQSLIALASAHIRIHEVLNANSVLDRTVLESLKVVIAEALVARNLPVAEFNSACIAITRAGITIREIDAIPDDIPLCDLPDLSRFQRASHAP